MNNSERSAAAVLDRLRAGNERYLSGDTTLSFDQAERRAACAEGQRPFATVIGCADSRVPAEVVFDQGIGDLFVIRVAGNIITPSQVASVEFAALEFETQLVVVLGHSKCGAVAATIDVVKEGGGPPEGSHLGEVVDRVRPAVESLQDQPVWNANRDELVAMAVRANVEKSVADLTSSSQILERLVREGKLQVVGAEYSLDTGQVEFLAD